MTDRATTKTAAPGRATRDPRLDFFRGLGMFIILYAHIPGSEFVNWIPARFGFSDATEIFVCCSGFASSFAFGRTFIKAGWRIGATRILYRVWQVYWAHVGVFIVSVASLAWLDGKLGTKVVSEELNLEPFLANPGPDLGHFLTLTYVPNFFDILPMYLVILAMVPLMMALAGKSFRAMVAFSLILWLATNFHLTDLPAEPWSDRPWFFNPFGWQLVFFTGFSFGMGWLPAPPRDGRLIALSILILAAAMPFSCHWGFECYALWGASPWSAEIHEALLPALIDKTHFGVLRYVHFLALAYLAFLLAGEGGRALRGWFVEAMMRVGQKTLAVFLSGLLIAQWLGVVLTVIGHGPLMQIAVNLGGSFALYGVAVTVDYFKNAGKRASLPPARRQSAPATQQGIADGVAPAE